MLSGQRWIVHVSAGAGNYQIICQQDVGHQAYQERQEHRHQGVGLRQERRHLDGHHAEAAEEPQER